MAEERAAMRNKIGTACMVLGTVLILAALFLFIRNQIEARQAQISVGNILPQVVQYIENGDGDLENQSESLNDSDSDDSMMTEVEIDGYNYIGYLSIPALELELPVMSQWDYDRLKMAPCRYSGSTKTDDLVVAAHNYIRHFGALSKLLPGDMIYFIDMDGVQFSYEVIEVDTLSPTAVEEMTSGEYDLTLFTCTYGGRSRVTVRCEQVMD